MKRKRKGLKKEILKTASVSKKVVQTDRDRLEVWAGALIWLDLCFCRIVCIAPSESSAEAVVENSVRMGSYRGHLP